MSIFWFLKPKITYQSKINGEIVIGLKQNHKALFSGGVTQSGGEIKPMWDEVIKNLYRSRHSGKRSASRIDPGQARMTNILILGVGGGSVIQTIRNYDQHANITGVEVDPVMKQVAIEQFNIQENDKQKIIIADAIKFLFQKTKSHQYDLIVVDLYIGPLNPKKGRTKKFLEQLKKTLKPKGTVLFNAHYQEENTGEYESFRKNTDAIFRKVAEVFSYPLNRVLLMKS